MRFTILVFVMVVTTSGASAEECPCHHFYIEPTLAVGGTTVLTESDLGDGSTVLEGGTVVLSRAALGWAARPGHSDKLELRLGAALVIGSGDLSHSTALGLGLETELGVSIGTDLRLGARAGIERHGLLSSAASDGATTTPALGVRLRIRDIAAVGVDGVYVHYDSALWGRSTGAGIMGTVSIDGRAGRVGFRVGAVHAILTATVFALGFLVLANSG